MGWAVKDIKDGIVTYFTDISLGIDFYGLYSKAAEDDKLNKITKKIIINSFLEAFLSFAIFIVYVILAGLAIIHYNIENLQPTTKRLVVTLVFIGAIPLGIWWGAKFLEVRVENPLDRKSWQRFFMEIHPDIKQLFTDQPVPLVYQIHYWFYAVKKQRDHPLLSLNLKPKKIKRMAENEYYVLSDRIISYAKNRAIIICASITILTIGALVLIKIKNSITMGQYIILATIFVLTLVGCMMLYLRVSGKKYTTAFQTWRSQQEQSDGVDDESVVLQLLQQEFVNIFEVIK